MNTIRLQGIRFKKIVGFSCFFVAGVILLLSIPALASQNESNYALNFDGYNDLALIPHHSIYSRPVYTVEFWFKPLLDEIPDTPNYADLVGLFSKAQNTGTTRTPCIQLDSLSRKPPYLVNVHTQEGTINRLMFHTPEIIEKDNWYHCAFVADGTLGLCYIDGILAATDSTENPPTIFSTAPICLAQVTYKSASTRHFEGQMDEVRFWSVARSGEEIRQTMNQMLEGDEPGLIGRWGFDEAGGQSLIDSSPTGNSGFLGFNASAEYGDPQRVLSDAPIHRLPAVNVSAWIEPQSPRTGDDLECITEAEPIEVGAEMPPLDWSYRWFLNGNELTEGMEISGVYHTVTGPVLSNLFTAKNDTVSCSVQVSDGTHSFEQGAGSVTIGNSTPTAPVVIIIPENPTAAVGFAADIQVYSIDPDGDPIKYEIHWYRSQDGGQTYVYKAELSGYAPDAVWVPPAFLADGDLWRVEVIPVEMAAQTKVDSATGVEQEQEEEQGEMAWYEVFVGENSVPTISLLSPGSEDVWVLGSHTWLGWEIADSDGDALTLELLYDFDDRISGAIPIAQGISQSGRLQWEPPASLLTETTADLNSDSQLDWRDFMLLTANWHQSEQTGTKVKIFARVRDAKGAMTEAMSEGWVIFPDSCPSTFEGLQAWMKLKKQE